MGKLSVAGLKLGAAEDQFLGSELLGAAFRSRHHFHNPLRQWDQAGLNATSLCPPFILSGEASVRWAQNPNQGITGKASWGDARQAFLEALTLSSRNDRDSASARTFQILGQQMHLVADLAVPAHTRNDSHCPLPDSFEAWTSGNRGLVENLIAGAPKRPNQSIFTVGVPILDTVARVPIARLWDTDQYTGSNPSITLSPTIGLSEYSNANFFSKNTIFADQRSADDINRFPFPNSSDVELWVDPSNNRKYWRRKTATRMNRST